MPEISQKWMQTWGHLKGKGRLKREKGFSSKQGGKMLPFWVDAELLDEIRTAVLLTNHQNTSKWLRGAIKAFLKLRLRIPESWMVDEE
jgi:hypothetical protein